MATQVRETKAGSSVSAYVVLNKKGEHVATVNAHFANSGRVSVDVWNLGTAVVERCLDAAILSGAVTEARLEKAIGASEAKRDWAKKGSDEHTGFAAFDLFGLQQGNAGGGGYDKFAASIRGMWIDGVLMTDHCGRDAKSEKLMAQYQRAAAKHEVRETIENHTLKISYAFPEGFQKAWDAKAKKIGAHFANFNGGKYQSLHISAGLKRLEELGYTVIQAI